MKLLSLVLVIICSITQLALCQDPSVPIFASNYHVQGLVSLPYAELNEPFEAWYDHELSRSRTDYYGDLYKIYQFGPRSSNGRKPTGANRFGAMYKLVYVPASFQPDRKPKQGLVSRLHHAYEGIVNYNPHANLTTKPATKRACFSVEGSVGNTISPQSVLPDLRNFKFERYTRCPYANEEFRHQQCELWKSVTEVGEKKNTYKMWITRKDSVPIPVLYYMLGYDTLMSSHYDRYDIVYRNFQPGSASDDDFKFDSLGQNCGPMPGPGNDASSAAQRSHMVVQNPIHELVVDPHRYDHIDHEFDKFKNDHSKIYDNDKHARSSWHNFLHNFRFINSKNRELKHYKLKVNRFADNDLNKISYLRGRRQSGVQNNGGLDYAAHHNLKTGSGHPSDNLPEEWNWVIRGAVTPVKDQAICGSCWSFGTSGTLEGAYFVKTGRLPILSQQQMIDCSWQYGNNGCDGGEDFRAYKYIMDAGGLSTQEDYGHYMGIDGKCHDQQVRKTVKISGFYNVTTNSVEALKHAVKNYGPVTVAIDASRPTFTFYSHGVYYDDKCKNSSDSLDHQVLVVGYAKIDGKFVWIVKNSWSTYWGDNGYIMMSAENNNCGVMDMPTVPIIEI